MSASYGLLLSRRLGEAALGALLALLAALVQSIHAIASYATFGMAMADPMQALAALTPSLGLAAIR